MKLKYIALGIGLLTAMFSCSMEDNIVPDTKGQVEGVSEEMYAALQFNISTGTDLNTKATSGVTGPKEDADYSEMEKDTEMAVNHCFIFVANGDKIIGRRHYTEEDLTEGENGSYTTSKHIMVKVPNEKPDLTVFAVGMKSDNENTFANGLYLSATSLDALRRSTVGKNSGDVGNSLTDFIKVGEGTIPAADYGTSAKTTDFTCNKGSVQCGSVNIGLHLRAAAIELVSFEIMKAGANEPLKKIDDNSTLSAPQIRAIVKDVIVTPQVVNTVLSPTEEELAEGDKVYANKTNADPSGHTSFMIAYNAKLEKAKSEEDKEKIRSCSHPLNHRFYTYQNANAINYKTKVAVQYEVEGVPGECTFHIKTGGTGDDAAKVLAGHLYQLHVKIINSVASVKVVTKDWNYNRVEQDMVEEVTE